MRGFWSVVSLLFISATAWAASVDSVVLSVGDLQSERNFFTQVLDFKAESAQQRGKINSVRLRLGEEAVELQQCSPFKPMPSGMRSNDRAFQHIAIIVSDMQRAHDRLRHAGVKAVSEGGPQTLPAWNPNAGGIEAFYFQDPEGHVLEILHFPADKGLAKWHKPSESLFLGIDHTAIVVKDTSASLAFYRDRLGLAVAGRSDNHGPEQERLNHVSGAHLRITALRGEHGPGVEFLEYLHPTDGRDYPKNVSRCDGLAWRTVVRHDTLSSGAVRDPDGHFVDLQH